MATTRDSAARERSRAGRRCLAVVGVILIAAAIYLCFAAAIIVLLALTDITGFLRNASSIALLFILIGAGLSLGLIGLQLLGRKRDRHHSARSRATGRTSRRT